MPGTDAIIPNDSAVHRSSSGPSLILARRILAIGHSFLVGALAFGCAHQKPSHAPPSIVPVSAAVQPAGIHLRDVAGEAGLNYHWEITGKRPLNILQTIGNGCAFLDYDGDGNLDILLIGPKPALFRGDGKGHFQDVSAQTGLDRLQGHFLGCCVGDYDSDGFDDIYVSAYRGGVLLHNEPGSNPSERVFKDVTSESGIAPQPWGTSCGFADLDHDGLLDLYIANYVKFDPDVDIVLCPEQGILTGCGPRDYDAMHGVLYRNLGQGRFSDVTKSWNAKSTGKSLGVAFANFQTVNRTGFAVANDLESGDLFRTGSGGKLENVGKQAGVAGDREGAVHAGMGIDWGDFDNDGKPDLFVTTFGDETKCLYRNDGTGVFTDVSAERGVEKPTLPFVGWGCKFFDADNDGWLDLMIANGHVQDNVAKFEKSTYRQPVVFMHNLGPPNGMFEDGTKSSGVGRLPRLVGRGLAVGDYDNDGLVDVLIVDSEGKPILLHNESGTPKDGWVGLKLIGSERTNRSAYGSVCRVIAGGKRYVRQCHPGGSYLSSSDPRVHFGLGTSKIESITVWWPDGIAQSWTDIKQGRYLTVKEGESPESAR